MKMHIMSGKYKGKTLAMPKTGLRPTTQIVKKAMFDIIHDHLQEAEMLDVFAGSGLVGIEALSNGAKSVDFVEKNYQAVATIKKNLESVNEKQKVYKMDFRKYFKILEKKYDFIFFSPPYYEGFEDDITYYLSHTDCFKDDGFAIVQIFKKYDLPYDKYDLELFDFRQYGITKLYFLRKKSNNLEDNLLEENSLEEKFLEE